MNSTTPNITAPNPTAQNHPFIPAWLDNFTIARPNLLVNTQLLSPAQCNHRINDLSRRCQSNINFLLKLTGRFDSIQAFSKDVAISKIYSLIAKGDDSVDRLIDIITCDEVGGDKYGNLFFAYGAEDYQDCKGALPNVRITKFNDAPILITEWSPSDACISRNMHERCQYVRHFLIPLVRAYVNQALQEFIPLPADLESRLNDSYRIMLTDLKRYLSEIPEQRCIYTPLNGKKVAYTLIPGRFSPYKASSSLGQ